MALRQFSGALGNAGLTLSPVMPMFTAMESIAYHAT